MMLVNCKITLKPCRFLLISDVSMQAYCCDVFQGQDAVLEDENATKDDAQENKEASCKEEVFIPTVFVNTRRGKGNGTKRKISDTATVTECDANIPPSAAEVLHIVAYPTQIHVTNRTTTKWHVINAL